MEDPNVDIDNLKAMLKRVVWDYDISEDDLLKIFLGKKEGHALNEGQLKARILNTYNWYFLLNFFGKEVAMNFLDDKVTKYLFPRSLKEKYVRAGKILYS